MRDETADERFLIKSIYLATVKSLEERRKNMSLVYFRETHERKFVRYSSRTGFSDSLDVALFVKYYFDD